MEHFNYMLITNLATNSETTWLVVDIFENTRKLQGKRLVEYDSSITPMFFCVKPERWKVYSEIHTYKNYINEWIDFVL